MNLLRNIIFHYPHRMVFGTDSLRQMVEDYLALGYKRFFIVTDPAVVAQISPALEALKVGGIALKLYLGLKGEPSFADYQKIMAEARAFDADSVAGIGGGSAMDVAKVAAALLHTDQSLGAVVGNGLLKERGTYLMCMPTTSGTGSEVSPNAILIDDKDGAKKGIISPFLVPDSVYVDPSLTVSLPASITAYTGIDALTHCIEAYTNRFAHPMADMLALEGIRLISRNLQKVVEDGQNLEARSQVAMGSVYGGMCLGPVNTAAVHALAYPLGTQFKIAHGLSNALLLPYVMQFNLPAAEERYAAIASAMGAAPGASDAETALEGVTRVRQLIHDCQVPSRLSELDIPSEAIPEMAHAAMEIQRLLKNNVREVKLDDAISIYQTAY